jgi:uncharacterized membrane protein HdeD (DUF308 family)
MSSQALSPDAARSSQGTRAAATVDARQVANLWWLWLVTGIAWIIAALVVLQFDAASIKTIGVIVGCMFIFAGVQQLMLALVGRGWLWAVVAGFFWIAGVVCIVNPEETFAGLADTLGFLFAVVGIWWTVEAVISQSEGGLWWIGLIAGILMFIIAFWVGGQFFIEKAYALLVFAGMWALMKGVSDIVRAFAVRSLRTGG